MGYQGNETKTLELLHSATWANQNVRESGKSVGKACCTNSQKAGRPAKLSYISKGSMPTW